MPAPDSVPRCAGRGEKNAFMPAERYNAIVRLLTFFAEQLSALSNQLLVEEQNREPTIVSKARRYIEEHRSEKISLAEVTKPAVVAVPRRPRSGQGDRSDPSRR